MILKDRERVISKTVTTLDWHAYMVYSVERVFNYLKVTIHEMGVSDGNLGYISGRQIVNVKSGTAKLSWTSTTGTKSVDYSYSNKKPSDGVYTRLVSESKLINFTRLSEERNISISFKINCNIVVNDGHTFSFSDTVSLNLTVPQMVNFNITRFVNLPTDGVGTVATRVIDKKDNTITLEGAVYKAFAPSGAYDPVQLSAGTKHIQRSIPELTHVVEWNNRLWGVNDADNTIYASKLGDPKNWRYYQQTNMDSYYANQATLGKFTGVGKYSNHLVFFKENVLHKVYGSAPSSFQVITQDAYGVKEGCEKSVAVVNDAIIYYSRHGFMVYEGETPYRTGYKLGETNYSSIEAAENDSKYYGHTRDDAFGDVLLVFDLETGCWYVESCNCGTDGKVVMAKHNGLLIKHDTLNGFKIIEPVDTFYEELEEDFEWHGVFKFDEFIENAKIYSKIDARVILSEGSTLKVEIAMDKPSFGDVTEWIKIGEYTADGGEVVAHVPIIPRRCNNFYVRLSGTGKSKLLSMTRKYRPGSARYKR